MVLRNLQRSLIPEWYKPWKWYLPWHTSDLDDYYRIYSHFAGFGPFQFHWWDLRKGLFY